MIKTRKTPTPSRESKKSMRSNSRKKADIRPNNTQNSMEHEKMKPADRKAFATEFFNRQIIMKELGQKGQNKLAKAKVAIVGAGGAGPVSSLYLSLSGVGCLRFIHQDTGG